MGWRLVETVVGWGIELAMGEGKMGVWCEARPDLYGQIRSYGYRLPSPYVVNFDFFRTATALARASCPAVAGRYGTRFSDARRMYCLVLVEKLNGIDPWVTSQDVGPRDKPEDDGGAAARLPTADCPLPSASPLPDTDA